MDPSSPERTPASSEPTVPDLPHGITAEACDDGTLVLTAPGGVTAGEVVDAVKALREAGVEADRVELLYLPGDVPGKPLDPDGQVWRSAVEPGPTRPWLSAVPDDYVDRDATAAKLAALDKFLAAGRADLLAHLEATVDVEAGLRDILGDQP